MAGNPSSSMHFPAIIDVPHPRIGQAITWEDEGCDELNYPEKKLTRFAFMVALLEKASYNLGNLNFIWATVVLLGGFAQSLESKDFWFVSVILVLEGLCIFCRRAEGAASATRWFIPEKNFPLSGTSKSFRFFDMLLQLFILYSLLIQFVTAVTCILLSVQRVGDPLHGEHKNRNRNLALRLFYGMSMAQASLILLGFIFKTHAGIILPLQQTFLMTERIPIIRNCSGFFLIISHLIQRTLFRMAERIPIIRNWQDFFLIFGHLNQRTLFSQVTRDYHFDRSQLVTVPRFLFDAYSRCVIGSVYDGLKMQFVPYSVELLQSNDGYDQQMGAGLLCELLKKDQFASEKLGALGTMQSVLELLVEMLNWEKLQQEKIRKAAAEIISNLVKIGRYRIRVMAITASLESIASLLYDSNQIEVHSRQYPDQYLHTYTYDYSAFRLLGFQILKMLANDQDHCAMIGSNRGLLGKIIGLAQLYNDTSEWRVIYLLKFLPIDTLDCLPFDRLPILARELWNMEVSTLDDPNLQSG